MTRRARPIRRQRGRARAKPVVPPKPGPQAVRLASALQALTKGLANPWDESTDYFHGFAAVMPPSIKLDAQSFRATLAVGQRYELSLSPAADVLARLGSAAGERGEDVAGGFRQLAAVMQATLTELTLAFARGKGVVRVRVWLFGRASDGALVGLRSIATET